MNKSLHILHIEDSTDDSELVERLLKKEGLDCTIKRIDTREQLFDALEHSPCDVILSDCTLPGFSGFQALEIAHALKPQIPFIFVSGTIGEDTAIKSLQDGATDYVLKHRLSRLGPAVRRALSEAHEKSMLRALQGRLHQARRLEAIGSLAGGLGRDFNNVLQILKAHIALLFLEADKPENVLEIAKTLDRATDRGSEMMKELLMFSRKTDAHLTLVDVEKLVQEVVEGHQNWLPDHVDIVVQLEKGLSPIFADPGQVDRMLTNLIMNSRDAMPNGGTILISGGVIRFETETPQPEHINNDLYFCLKVIDTGTGMDEQTRAHIFEPFYTTKTMENGTGLGLSVVFGLMQVHNGLIDVQSKPNEGTAVSLFFPLPQGSNVSLEKIKTVPVLVSSGKPVPTG